VAPATFGGLGGGGGPTARDRGEGGVAGGTGKKSGDEGGGALLKGCSGEVAEGEVR
jgi:hypothetical protein